MDELYVYYVDLPGKIHEMVTPCYDGYTIYIADRLDEIGQRKAYCHALRHIYNGDFNKTDVQSIEWEAHL
jgi:hypothetical protein